MPDTVKLQRLLLAIAATLTIISGWIALFAPVGPHSARGLQFVLTFTAVSWILWGQMAHADRRREERASADAYLRLIVGGKTDEGPQRRTRAR